jgi:hypothetical protein
LAEKKDVIRVKGRADKSVEQLVEHWVGPLAVMMVESLVDGLEQRSVERMAASKAEKKAALLGYERADMLVANLAEHWVASLAVMLVHKLVD